VAPAPPAAIDLAFDVTEAATHAVFFFDGAISTSERLFKEGKGLGIERTWNWENFECGLRALNKSIKM